MRIAQVAPLHYPVPPPLAGGTERIIASLTEALMSAGHDVTLFAADGSSTSARLQTCGAPGCAGGNTAGTRAVSEAAMLRDVLDCSDGFDVVHCHTEYYHAAVLAAINQRVLTTLHWRTDELDRQLLFKRFPELQCVCISQHQQRAVPMSNRAAVVHHGLPVDSLSLGDGQGGYLAFLGRLTDQKRPDLAIDVANRAGLPLKLAGNLDIGNPDYFTQAVRPRLVPPHTFVGEVGEQGKAELLQGALALLMPVNWPEPFGLVVIEAMACGTPVIAWRHGSMPELIADSINGFVVDTVDEAVSAVRRCASLSRSRIRECFETEYSSARMARDYVAAYHRILRTSSSRCPVEHPREGLFS